MYQQISILKELHKRIKIQCAKENRSIIEFVTSIIEEYLKTQEAKHL